MYCSSDITAFFSQFRSHDSKSEYKSATLCSSYIYDVVIFSWTNWSLRQGSRTLREGYPHVLRRSGNQNGQPPSLHPAPCTLHPLARSAAVAPVPSSQFPFAISQRLRGARSGSPRTTHGLEQLMVLHSGCFLTLSLSHAVDVLSGI
jgi:hypothetical protein